MLSLRSLPLSLLSCAVLALAQFEPDSTPYTPIVVPLAVRGPYVGAYLTGRQEKDLATMSPHFWTTAPLGWSGLLRVDGEVWNWMGNLTEWPAAASANYVHTSSATTFVLHAGKEHSPSVSLTASFLSPVTPTDLFRQSLPFSYLSLSVASLDGRDHKVEVYSDINGLWAADGEEEELEWSSESGQRWVGSRFALQDQRSFQEESDRILEGDVWYVAQATGKVLTTSSAGHDAASLRKHFGETGALWHGANSTFRNTRTRGRRGDVRDEPVFALAHSFGTITPSTSSLDSTALVAIGHVRDPIVQYMTAGEKVTTLRPYWTSRFDSTHALIDFVLADHSHVRELSEAWNRKLYADARRVHSEEYAHILAISTRQIFMAIEAAWDVPPPTLLTSTLSLPSFLDPLARSPTPLFFLKEISSNGNCQTVDIIAPMLPFLLYFSPPLLAGLLEPIYRYVSTGLYLPLPPPHDLGDAYPNATGRNDFLYSGLPLEESGNMLAIAAAGLQMGKEGREQAAKYYGILKAWAGYLVVDTLFPVEQRTTDDFFGPSSNQTSLVVKGIIGLRSMSDIASALGFDDDRDYYLSVSENYAEQFLKLAISKDKTHLLGAYGNQTSWVTQYNLYLDKLLGTEIFPASLYKMQDAFYPTQAQPFGVPLDSRFPERAKTDWLLWAAGASTARPVVDLFVNAVGSYFRQSANLVMGDSITPADGWSVGFLSRPVVGGHFSLLGLETLSVAREMRLRKLEMSEDEGWRRWGIGFAVIVGAGWAGFELGKKDRRKRGGRGKYMELPVRGMD